jgi:hypothetical protein
MVSRVVARALVSVLVALAAASSVAAAPPKAGLVVPGRTLGGLQLGATPGQVRAAWGPRFGRCRDCPERTWYYNFTRFEPQGAGVSFRRGRAAALFTLWSPPGWRTNRGLAIGDPAVRVAGLYGPLLRVTCTIYYALTMRRRGATTAIYVFDEQVWGFALLARGERVCR